MLYLQDQAEVLPAGFEPELVDCTALNLNLLHCIPMLLLQEQAGLLAAGFEYLLFT